MKERLEAIKKAALEKIEQADAMESLNDIRVSVLGKKGELTKLLKGMGKLSAEERPVMGKVANEVRELIETKINEKITQLFSKYQIIFLAIAVFGIFNSEGEVVFNNLNSILLIFIPLILFFIINFILDFIVAKNMKFNYENYTSLTMTTLARNSPLALAIAVNSFPESQLILIGLVIGPLIELPVLYGISKLLLAIKKRY